MVSPPRRPWSARLVINLGLFIAVTAAQQSPGFKIPVNVNFGVVFPRNETYSRDLINKPVVIAIENASVLYWYSYYLNWVIRSEGDSPRNWASGSFETPTGKRVSLPPDAIGNN